MRADPGDPWDPPTRVEELAGIRANTPEIARDGLTMYLAIDSGGGDQDIFVTRRADRASPWGTPERVVDLASADSDTGAHPFDFGIVFHSTRPGGSGADDLWLARYEADCETRRPPAPLAGVNTEAGEANPWMRADGLLVLFQRAGDIHGAVRASLDDPFSRVTPIAALNGAGSDDDPWLSNDGAVIYFASPRSGDSEIYLARALSN